jgi:peptidoglycan hydrolase-like protein with peptidoglycan-binding domain
MMIRIILSVVFIFLLIIGPVHARDDRKNYSIQEAYEKLNIESQLGKVKLYFYGEAHPAVQRRIGMARTNRKTNAFNKTDKYACQWVFFSTLLQLRDRALADGGNAVINIKSNYKNQEFSSTTEFQCGVGRIIAGVALTGEVVTLSGGSSRSVRRKGVGNSSSPKTSKCSEKKISDMKSIDMTDEQIAQLCGQSSKLSSYDDSTARGAQAALNIQGYNVGTPDGLWGKRSRKAMKQFQKQNNLNATGEIDNASLKALGISGLSASPNEKNSGSANESSTTSPPTGSDMVIPTHDDDLFSSDSNEPEQQVDNSVINESVISSFKTHVQVNLYSEPDPFSEIVSVIPKNVKLDIINEGAEWLKVTYKGNSGFVVKAEVQ